MQTFYFQLVCVAYINNGGKKIMAKLRLNGFCPKSELETFALLHTEKMSNDSVKALKLLGNRTQSLVYPKHEMHYGVTYVTLVLMTTNNLAMELANKLAKILPAKPLHDEGRKVLIHDVISPSRIPDVTVAPGDAYNFVLADPKSTFSLMQDNNFLVALCNTERYAEMYIYRKDRMPA